MQNDHKGLYLRESSRGSWDVCGRKPTGLENTTSTVITVGMSDSAAVSRTSLVPAASAISARQYLESITPTASQFNAAPTLQGIMPLPVKRELPWAWMPMFGNRSNLRTKAMLATLVYLTGDELAECCLECQQGARPTTLGKSCIVQHNKAHRLSLPDVALSAACASCILRAEEQHKTLSCSLIQPPQPPRVWPRPAIVSKPQTIMPSREDTPGSAAGSATSESRRLVRRSTAEAREVYTKKRDSPSSDFHVRGSQGRESPEQSEEIWAIAPGRATIDLGHGPKSKYRTSLKV